MSDAAVEELSVAAVQLADTLKQSGQRVVFAESCTAGLIAATLAEVPGISNYLCGSAVVYRNGTKTAWLGVSAPDLADESIGPVSEQVAAAMAVGVLERTPEANLSASVTGHLGPDAPEHLDGVIYIGVARRDPETSDVCIAGVNRHMLLNEQPPSSLTLRHVRQQAAAVEVMKAVAAAVESTR